MMRMLAVILLMFATWTLSAKSFQGEQPPQVPKSTGMFLCRTPAGASGLWSAWVQATGSGIDLSYSNEAKSAEKNDCFRVNSDHLKPTGERNSELFISDGRAGGFAEPAYYIVYMRTHRVEAE